MEIMVNIPVLLEKESQLMGPRLVEIILIFRLKIGPSGKRNLYTVLMYIM